MATKKRTPQKRKPLKLHKIFVSVRGGVAYVEDDTVPKGIEIEIVDFDNIEAGDDYPSEEAREYFAEK